MSRKVSGVGGESQALVLRLHGHPWIFWTSKIHRFHWRRCDFFLRQSQGLLFQQVWRNCHFHEEHLMKSLETYSQSCQWSDVCCIGHNNHQIITWGQWYEYCSNYSITVAMVFWMFFFPLSSTENLSKNTRASAISALYGWRSVTCSWSMRKLFTACLAWRHGAADLGTWEGPLGRAQGPLINRSYYALYHVGIYWGSYPLWKGSNRGC